MKTKCLFICPTKYNYIDVKPERVKYSVLSLMSHIVDLADVELIDFEMLFGYPRTMEEIRSFLKYVENKLIGYKADIIAISCYTSYDYLSTIDILRICHKILPQATLVVGGYHPTAVPEDFLNVDVPIDFIIRGEGEEALRDIIIQNARNIDKVIMGRQLDLANEKPLRYDLYPYKTDELYISLSRGCFHRCSFCVQSDDFENRYRKMDIERLKEKITRATEYFPIKRLLFSDPIFGIDVNATNELVDFLDEKFPNYSYWAETRIDRTSDELMKCLSRLNIDLHFGVESLAEDTLLNLMEKTVNAEHYNECFFKTVDLCQKYNVLGLFGFIMNYPGEKVESYRYTLDQLWKVVNMYNELNVTFHINQYALYPGNKIYTLRHDLAKTRGFNFPNDKWWHSYEPDIRTRSEDCIASDSFNNVYGENIHYWHKEKNELQESFTAKFNYKAYKFYQRKEIQDSLEALKISRDTDNYDVKFDLSARYRNAISKILRLYNLILDVHNKEFKKIFNKFFVYVTYMYQNEILSSCNRETNLHDDMRKIEELEEVLKSEYDLNKKNLQIEKQEFYDAFLIGKRYRISMDGNIQQIN